MGTKNDTLWISTITALIFAPFEPNLAFGSDISGNVSARITLTQSHVAVYFAALA